MREGERVMSKILSDAKKLYPIFFRDDQWNDEMAATVLESKKDVEKRKKVIRAIYDIILDKEENVLNKHVQKWIRTGLSLADVANLDGINVNTLKSSINYFNKTIGNDLTIYNGNVLKVCVVENDLVSNDWDEIEGCLEFIAIKYGKRIYKKEKVISNKNMLVNIPKKELCRQISDEEFNVFMRLIEPYFVSQRKIAQEKINNSVDAVGYFNYITMPGIVLSEKDLRRRKVILDLLDEDTVKEFRRLNREKAESIKVVEEPVEKSDITRFEDMDEKQQAEAVVIKTKRIQF